MMKIAYVTNAAPHERGESFVTAEIGAIQRAGHSVLIIPTITKLTYDSSGYDVCLERLLSLRVLIRGMLTFVRHPVLSTRAIWGVLVQSGSRHQLIFNMAVVPKALAMVHRLRNESIDCIHAHWMTIPSTMAFIISSIANIPCIATAHRFDIYKRNAPVIKTEHFSAIRVMNARGKQDFLSLLPSKLHHKVHLIHMGVEIPATINPITAEHSGFHVAVPANLIFQKGHSYALQALKHLTDEGHLDIVLHFFGSGEEEAALRNEASRLNVNHQVVFHGHIPHTELLSKYASRDIDCVLLASFEINEEAFEGIPVSLLEAMSYRISVIATDSGGIPELVNDECGMLIPQKDAPAIAQAILRLKNDKAYAQQIASKGRLRVEADFSGEVVAGRLERLMLEATKMR